MNGLAGLKIIEDVLRHDDRRCYFATTNSMSQRGSATAFRCSGSTARGILSVPSFRIISFVLVRSASP